MQSRDATMLTLTINQAVKAAALQVITIRPVGAPGMAICLVLMTVSGNKHVVTPCKTQVFVAGSVGLDQL